ncbi:Uncharacterised protein [Candidatus Bilamarchaeum dharawalense]|uniref:Glycosyltransferase RgtA/B/C/D-like domain-containing protein n=1 Tax=Candidatus Bilamarchaeum dharawalense TaxID=2885759 RepID=A0A5E4LQD4_9ARCH|nr:Uncharacterised protein [Candidatus Bilamarchaeum dharawalense]
MKILNFSIPHTEILLCLLITSLLTFFFFYPSIMSFGKVLVGAEDIKFGIWMLWHFEQSVQHGTNPLMANEVFYPYGISLTTTVLSPIHTLLYCLLPSSLGTYGRITILQVIPFILGGLFSFVLAYRFTKSFLPSMLASLVYNFSAFHFEKALHHLNYSMAMPWVALFFIFYFEMVYSTPKKRLNYLLLSFAFLMVAFSELTITIMLSFIVFLDIFSRYLDGASIKLWTPRNTIILALSVLLSFVLYESFAFFGISSILTYTVPSLLFFGGCLLILGPKALIKTESKFKYFQMMVTIAVPVVLYLLFLFLQPSYPFYQDSIIVNIIRYAIPLDRFVLDFKLDIPALSQISFFEHIKNVWNYDAEFPDLIGVLLTLLFLLTGPFLFPLISAILPSASKEEIYFRNFSLLCIAFSFPIIKLGDSLLFVTPFLTPSLFPLMPVLRVPARFLLFALLFLSVLSALVLKRLLKTKNLKVILFSSALFLLVFIQSMPNPERFIFQEKVPQFYLDLAKDESAKTIFIYPYANYYSLMNELYYQTFHGKPISLGLVSRFPDNGNDLFVAYNGSYFDNQSRDELAEKTTKIMNEFNYDYLVFDKVHCLNPVACFFGDMTEYNSTVMDQIQPPLEQAFGKPIYEDDTILVYLPKNRSN